MIREFIRAWRTETRGANYTDQILAATLAAARGDGGSIKSTAAYTGSLNLIGHATGVATLTGLHASALQEHLSTIARAMVDVGESTWLIQVGSAGGLQLLPCSAVDVVGGPDPRSWLYQLQVQGPTQTVTLQRSGESILSFRLRVDARTPWKGRPALDSTGTSQLLAQLEEQMRSEARVSPARIIAGGAVVEQAGEITENIRRGGVVTLIQSLTSRDDPAGVKAGVVRNEVTAASVSLHEKLSTLICSVMGVPSDLILGSGSESGSRESFRRLASTTINNILTTITREWQSKLGTDLQWDLDRLRSSDEVSRARAIGSRANAVSRLVDSGMDLPQALAVVGID